MNKFLFKCNNCGEGHHKWLGKCSMCNVWGSVEDIGKQAETIESTSVDLEILSNIKANQTQITKSMPEFDQVCGGGLHPKAVILLGGEPGIGKSTLLLQICNEFKSEKPAIYITGEEAVDQIKIRAERIGINMNKIACASATCVEDIVIALEKNNPGLVIVDSIQTMYSTSAESSAGSINQMRACTNLLIQWAKKSEAAIIIVGHVTKDGGLAGPKSIEHMVDTVLYFEGERGGQPIRILRTVKNRFGPIDILGVFEIHEQGLKPLKDISKAFINQRSKNASGSAILASIDGNRSILVEIQALISNSYLQSPRRSVVGWDLSRLQMITAILETKCKIILGNKDIYLNVIGGLKITEPASDLAAAIAILSAVHKKPIPQEVAAFGEISLSGEIRGVSKMGTRIAECVNLGFTKICVPKSCDDQQHILKFSKIQDVDRWIKDEM